MTTFTAEVAGNAILLTVASLGNAGECTIDRQPDGGYVRGTPRLEIAGGGFALEDVEFPFSDSPITYTLTVRDVDTGSTIEFLQASILPPDLTGSHDLVVENTLLGIDALALVTEEGKYSSESRNARFDLAGRVQPYYLYEFHTEWSWELEMVTTTKQQRDNMATVLRVGLPVLLRPAAGCDQEYGWVAVGSIQVDRYAGKPGYFVWQVELSRAGAVDSTIEIVRTTLQDLHEWEPTTLQAIHDRVPTTLLDLTLSVIRNA